MRAGASRLLWLCALASGCGHHGDPGVVGPQGGTVSLGGGKVQLSLPAGSVDASTTLTAQPRTLTVAGWNNVAARVNILGVGENHISA